MPQFYTLLTAAGIAKIANAGATGGTISLTHIALGDGGGAAVTPTEAATALVNEVHRGPINHLYGPSTDPSQIAAELVVLPNVGGWTIREVGVYDSDGDLLIYGSHPVVYKPVLAEGSGMDLTVVVRALVGNGAPITLKIDPAVVLATRKWVLDTLDTHKQATDAHPLASATRPGFAAAGSPGKLAKAYGEIADVITGAGLTPNDDIFTQLAQVLSRTAPPGAVAYFARASAPSGWLKCNGANVSRTTYAALFAAIGTTFGAGDGETTFALPDLRGEFLRGLDDGRGVDASRALGSAQAGDIGPHKHTSAKYIQGYGSVSGGQIAIVTGSTGGFTDIAGTSGLGIGTETRPRNIALLACIKY